MISNHCTKMTDYIELDFKQGVFYFSNVLCQYQQNMNNEGTMQIYIEYELNMNNIDFFLIVFV